MKVSDIGKKNKLPASGIPPESLQASECFEYYYALGDSDRSLVKVADHFDISIKMIEKWCAWYNWKARVIDRNYEIAERLRRKTNREIIKDKIEYRKIIKALLVSFINDVKAGKIKCKTINDFYKLISLDLSIQGSLSDDFNLERMEYLDNKVDNQDKKIEQISNETADTLNKLLAELKIGDDSGEVAEAVKTKG